MAAPRHIRQGSRVVKRRTSRRRPGKGVRRSAASSASSSAWTSRRRSARSAVWALAIISSPRTTTAPIGSSPRSRPSAAIWRAAVMKWAGEWGMGRLLVGAFRETPWSPWLAVARDAGRDPQAGAPEAPLRQVQHIAEKRMASIRLISVAGTEVLGDQFGGGVLPVVQGALGDGGLEP